jgi:uncharacterized cupin superfamily protein
MSKPPTLLKADEIRSREESHQHPWNPRSELHGLRLSAQVGFQRTGVSLVRVPPGKESFVYHLHYCEEEWIYILSGRGIAEIDGQEHEVGPGDFMGFAAPSVAHHLRNASDQDLVYLMGGENKEVEIADYPHHGKRLVRVGGRVHIYDLKEGTTMPGLPDLSDRDPGEGKP